MTTSRFFQSLSVGEFDGMQIIDAPEVARVV